MRKKRRNIDVGEWWVDDSGLGQYADGDIGDQNHEMVAFESALQMDLEEVDFHRRQAGLGTLDFEISANGFDWEGMAEAYLEEHEVEGGLDHVNKLSAEAWKNLADDLEVDDSLLKAGRDIALAFSWLAEHGANMEFVKWWAEQKGTPDAREYALEKWDWLRVKGSNFETWVFDNKALERIRRADIWEDAQTDDEEEVDNSEDEVTVSELSTNKRFTVQLKELLNDSIPLEGIKAIARGEEWALPVARPTPVFPKHTTDTAGPQGWAYGRIGDNPRKKRK
jgi:hypothetical protein